MARSEIAGPETPEKPYPLVVESAITSGFGRGSAELGIPTANISPGVLSELEPGIYYGWAKVYPSKSKSLPENPHGRQVDYNFGSSLGEDANKVLPVVMSIGWNPFYKNEKKSAEVHIMHKFKDDFYGSVMKLAVMGYIRPEQSYNNLDDLIEDIHTDIKVAQTSLNRPAYEHAKQLLD